jgi:ATP-binding cassette subfamily B protein
MSKPNFKRSPNFALTNNWTMKKNFLLLLIFLSGFFFSQVSQEQSKVIELINGMQEIKLQNAEKQKRWNWEFVQVKLFKVNIKSLSLEQWQSVGGNFINQMKDILVSFLSAKLVLSGNLTLGMMLSVQYIIGQLNSP